MERRPQPSGTLTFRVPAVSSRVHLLGACRSRLRSQLDPSPHALHRPLNRSRKRGGRRFPRRSCNWGGRRWSRCITSGPATKPAGLHRPRALRRTLRAPASVRAPRADAAPAVGLRRRSARPVLPDHSPGVLPRDGLRSRGRARSNLSGGGAVVHAWRPKRGTHEQRAICDEHRGRRDRIAAGRLHADSCHRDLRNHAGRHARERSGSRARGYRCVPDAG